MFPIIYGIWAILKSMGYNDTANYSIPLIYMMIILSIIVLIIIIIFRIIYKNTLYFKIVFFIVIAVFIPIEVTLFHSTVDFHLEEVSITYPGVTFIVIAIIIYLLSMIRKPLINLTELSDHIKKGDLTYSTEKVEEDKERKDEIGNLVNSFIYMYSYLKDLLQKNVDISQQLSKSAGELASSAEEISSSSENIASSQQEISRGALSQASSISQTQNQFKKLSEGIKSIRDRTLQINEISEFIQQISTQTEMLSLNASIEAAKAGDAGRGFSVVAEQVRNLAEDSKRSVARTNEILGQINSITKEQEASSQEIIHSVDLIAQVAEKTSVGTEESAASAEEQAASMEQISSVAQNMLKLAEDMQKILSEIQI